MPISLTDRRKPDPFRDGTGKYKITGPDGEVQSYTRATTVAGATDNEWALHRYERRMVAVGLGEREDLWMQSIGQDPDEHRDTLDSIADQAMEAAGASIKAGTGTGLHTFTELLDLGLRRIEDLPEKWHSHLEAWNDGLARSGFEVVPDYIEQIVANDHYQVAGQIDRVLRATRAHRINFGPRQVLIEPGELIVGDLKTGKIEFSRVKFAIQAATYAGHTCTWDVDGAHPHGGTRGPRIPVSPYAALLIHLPAYKTPGKVDLHWLDLEAGWDGFLTSLEVLEHRARHREVMTPWVDEHVPMEVAAAAWLKERAAAVARHPQALADLQRQWPPELRDPGGSIVPLAAEPTAEQVTALAAVLDRIEDTHQLPFQRPHPEQRQPIATPQTKELLHAHPA